MKGLRMRAPRRAVSALALALCVVAGLAAGPAAAVEGEKFTIRIDNDEKVTKAYDGMIVNDASSEFSGDPDTCAEAPFCTLVPLEVLLRDDFDPDVNEFVLTISLAWDDSGFNVSGQAAQGNDLDMYIYKQEENEDGELEYVEVGRSAGQREPEVAKLFTPSDKDYFIVVYNYLGVNTGFTLAGSYRDASIEDLPDYESGAPFRTPGSTSSGSDDASSAPAFDDSEVAATPTRPVFRSPSRLPVAPDSFSAPGSGGGTFAVPTAPDDGSVFDLPTGSERDLASDLAANQTQDVFKPRVASANPEPASPALLVFWLGVVPIVLAGAAAVVMLRRRPAALTLQLPKPSAA